MPVCPLVGKANKTTNQPSGTHLLTTTQSRRETERTPRDGLLTRVSTDQGRYASSLVHECLRPYFFWKRREEVEREKEKKKKKKLWEDSYLDVSVPPLRHRPSSVARSLAAQALLRRDGSWPRELPLPLSRFLMPSSILHSICGTSSLWNVRIHKQHCIVQYDACQQE